MMMLSQACAELEGRIIGPDAAFDAVSTDSRKIAAGDLFVALRGANFDGAEFIAVAAQGGAVAALMNADSHAEGAAYPIPVLLVDDTLAALGDLAAYWRAQFSMPVVGITGSNGKTTVKEMVSSILAEASGGREFVLATRGNLNNDIGLPLTLLALRPSHRAAVIEMGMNHSGEIEYLTHIAWPDVAIITNAAGAHLEGLGTVEAVARAKGEIFSGLTTGGVAVINADDEFAPLWRTLTGARTKIEFGIDKTADVSATWQPAAGGVRMEVRVPQGRFSASLRVPGAHNVKNALAATAAAVALEVPLPLIAAGLENFKGVAGRLERRAARNGAVLIDDTYNANPGSLDAALDVLGQGAGQKILVLGDMGELGDDALSLHARAGQAARAKGIDALLGLGELSAEAVRAFGAGGRHFANIEDLLAELDKTLDENCTVLIKGSRFMRMERVVAHCAVENAGGAASRTPQSTHQRSLCY